MIHKTLLILLFSLYFAATVTFGCTDENAVIAVQFGSNESALNERIESRIFDLIQSAAQFPVVRYESDIDLHGNLASGSIVLSFGNTNTTRSIISIKEMSELGSEGLIVRTDHWSSECGTNDILILATDGNKLEPDSLSIGGVNGLHYGSFAMLEELGFAFPHPLQPIIPKKLSLRSTSQSTLVKTKPRWPQRGTHYHSEHPLEFHEVLNGFGLNASQDRSDWEAILPEVDKLAEWLVANRQNRIEWILLSASDWAGFASGTERQSRLRTITHIFEQWGLAAGADVSIAERQQHAWYMVQGGGKSLEEEIKEIQTRLDWVLSGAGFHFLSTENGFSEFTHPGDERMLALINATANITTSSVFGKPKKAYIKCHCSTGQRCSHYKDPRTGELLNFNFLPMLSINEMGVYPHTVQFYSFGDPAPTYGNENFTYMLEFLEYEAKKGGREVVYHGETAYWVDYDINVPLFLPIYGEARLIDYRTIAAAENSKGFKIQGSMNFHSGLEWDYWLNDVINFAAAWDPLPELTLEEARNMIYGRIARWFDGISDEILELLKKYINIEHDLLVLGKVDGEQPKSVVRRNGQCYLEGWDMASEIGALFAKRTLTQPDRIGLIEVKDPLLNPNYVDIKPLLEAMETQFCSMSIEFASIMAKCMNECPLSLVRELSNSANITCQRAVQIHGLYDYSAEWMESQDWRKERLATAKSALQSAQEIVKDQSEIYRAKPIERMTGWRSTPTVYNYGYLWEPNSLYYFWRDYGKTLLENPEAFVPCYLNIYNIVDVAIGEGVLLNLTEAIRDMFDKTKWDVKYITDCLAEPQNEYEFPRDL